MKTMALLLLLSAPGFAYYGAIEREQEQLAKELNEIESRTVYVEVQNNNPERGDPIGDFNRAMKKQNDRNHERDLQDSIQRYLDDERMRGYGR